ncbi:MAG: hypothetical protein K5879_03845 [Lachnospiraceae bacterium]|nr:hypothetical protein [Lachnospiraceae bacterium]
MANQDVLQIRVENVDEKQVPSLIQEQFSVMGELRKEIERASNNAFDAKEAVINEVGPKAMSKKEAIENLQTATLSLADAQVDAMNAQKLSFEYQQKLADITKFLFRLGLTNIAMNRVVVEELEYKLRNASQEELDDLARAEIENLLKRLKMQQDIDQKQTELAKILKEQSELNDSQAKELNAQAEKDEEHDRRIDELYAIIAKQDQVIEKILIEMDAMHKDMFKMDEEIRFLRNK